MVESDVVVVLTEETAKLTERGIRKSDDAAVLELKAGLTPAVTALREEATVLLEAARRIRGLCQETSVRRPGKRGPNKHTTGGGGVVRGDTNVTSHVDTPVLAPAVNKW